MAELRTFTVVVSFLLIYSAFLGSAPVGLFSSTYDNPVVSGLNAQYLTGFDAYVQYDYSNYTGDAFSYSLGEYDWQTVSASGTNFRVGVKVYIWIIWVGTDWSDFSLDSESRGDTLTLVEINSDADNGTVRYTAICTAATTGVVFSWNTNDYTYAWDAWGNDSLYVTHGIGVSEFAPQNALSIVLGMLTFSIPDIPPLLQLLFNSPIYAGSIYLLWFFVKEVIPFL